MVYEAREPKEDTGAIQTFAVRNEDPDIEMPDPDVVAERGTDGDLTAAEVVALENMWMNAANRAVNPTPQEQKNYPRIDVMVDKNCLVSFTGHMQDFPALEFQRLVDKTIAARIRLDELWNERIIKGPREAMTMTGYQ